MTRKQNRNPQTRKLYPINPTFLLPHQLFDACKMIKRNSNEKTLLKVPHQICKPRCNTDVKNDENPVMKKFLLPHELFDRSYKFSEESKITTTSLEKKDETVFLLPHEICCKEPNQPRCESTNICVEVLDDVSARDHAKKDEDVDGAVMKKPMLPHELFDRSYKFLEKPKISTASLEKKKDETVFLLPHEIIYKEESAQPHCDSSNIHVNVLDDVSAHDDKKHDFDGPVVKKPKIASTSLEEKKKEDEAVLLLPHEIFCNEERVQPYCKSNSIHENIWDCLWCCQD